MFWIFLKLTLALALSAFPFVVKYYFIPKGKTDKKYKNGFTFLYMSTPNTRSKIKRFAKKLIGCIRKLEVSKKYRRLFLSGLVLFMVAFQMVNIKAGQEALYIANIKHVQLYKQASLPLLPLNINIASTMKWNEVSPIVNLCMLTILFIMIFYKSSNAIVCKIHSNKHLQIMLTVVILGCLLNPSGKCFSLGIFIYTILLAGFIYPPFNRRKSERYYAFQVIRKNKDSACLDRQ